MTRLVDDIVILAVTNRDIRSMVFHLHMSPPIWWVRVFLYIVAVLGDTPVGHGSRRRGSIPRVTTNGHCGNVKGGMSEWEGASLLRRGKMATEWASQFYGSTHWKKCRSGFISYKRGLCERCLAKGIVKPGRHVHHKIRLTAANITNPDVTLNWNNLELLCEECHEEEHSLSHTHQGQGGGGRRYSVGADGKIETNKESDRLKGIKKENSYDEDKNKYFHHLYKKNVSENEDDEE